MKTPKERNIISIIGRIPELGNRFMPLTGRAHYKKAKGKEETADREVTRRLEHQDLRADGKGHAPEMPYLLRRGRT